MARNIPSDPSGAGKGAQSGIGLDKGALVTLCPLQSSATLIRTSVWDHGMGGGLGYTWGGGRMGAITRWYYTSGPKSAATKIPQTYPHYDRDVWRICFLFFFVFRTAKLCRRHNFCKSHCFHFQLSLLGMISNEASIPSNFWKLTSR